MMQLLRLWVGLLAILLIAGCEPSVNPEVAPTQALEPSTATPLPTATEVPLIITELPGPAEVVTNQALEVTVPAQAAIVGLVVADLAAEMAVDPADIAVGSIEELVWSALACEAEEASLTAIEQVPGFQIELLIEGNAYTYRADAEGAFLRCQGDLTSAGAPVILDTNLNSLVDVAAQDLAARLDLPVRRVFVVDAYPLTWPDASLGCALTDEVLPPTPVAGYRIVLRVGSESYFYHANYRQVSLCPEAAVRLPTDVPLTEGPTAQE